MIECFLLVLTTRVKLSARRYASGDKCGGPFGYHNAMQFVAEAEARFTEKGYLDVALWPAGIPESYPAACGCGYEFMDADVRQLFQELLYRRSNGEEMTLRDAPPGAMWDATWMPRKASDGRYLVLKTPGGDWAIDGPSSNGNGWTRTGEPPNITANPSILAGKYHGWLRDGRLVEC